jgi:hypothetical protein
MADAAGLPEAPFGAALCVGNVLAYAFDEAELDRGLGGVAAALEPGGRLLLQLLNYERLATKAVRHLPVNFRELPEDEGDGEIVFLRFFSPSEDGLWDFYPVTLTLRPEADPPIRVRSARRAKQRAWRRADLEAALERVGFARVRALGGMSETPYVPDESADLVLIAERAR